MNQVGAVGPVSRPYLGCVCVCVVCVGCGVRWAEIITKYIIIFTEYGK